MNSNCPGDLVGPGDVLVLEPFPQVTIPRNPSQIKFDGRDKFATNLRVANGRSYWSVSAGPLFAGGEGFYSADGQAFYAVQAYDAASSDNTRNQAFDWGHALVPDGKLTDQAISGWAPGSDGLGAITAQQRLP